MKHGHAQKAQKKKCIVNISRPIGTRRDESLKGRTKSVEK